MREAQHKMLGTGYYTISMQYKSHPRNREQGAEVSDWKRRQPSLHLCPALTLPQLPSNISVPEDWYEACQKWWIKNLFCITMDPFEEINPRWEYNILCRHSQVSTWITLAGKKSYCLIALIILKPNHVINSSMCCMCCMPVPLQNTGGEPDYLNTPHI